MSNPFSASDGPFREGGANESSGPSAKSGKGESVGPSVADIFANNKVSSGEARMPVYVRGGGVVDPADANFAASQPKPYKPSGRVDVLFWALAAIFVPLTGIWVGYLYQLVCGERVSLPMTQFVIAFCTGACIGLAVWLGKCRNLPVAATVAIVATIAVYISYYGFLMAAQRPEYVAAICASLAQKSGATPASFAPQVNATLTPAVYCRVWFVDHAQTGYTLTSGSASSVAATGTPVSGAGFYLMALFELALSALLAGVIAVGIAGRRFHEESHQWYRRKQVFCVSTTVLPQLLQAAANQDWQRFSNLGQQYNVNAKGAGGRCAVFTLPGRDGGLVSLERRLNNRPDVVLEVDLDQRELDILLCR